MKKVVIMGLFISSFCVLSCNEIKDDNPDPKSYTEDGDILIPSTAKITDSKSLRASYQNNSEDYENFAKEVAKMMNSKEMRKFFKNESSKKFDGDYDILVGKHLDKFNNFKHLLNETPKLNLGFNELISNWNFDKNSILVATRINLIENSKKLIAYDKNGKKYEIDANKEPDQPIMVVGYNERVEFDQTGKLKLNGYVKRDGNNLLDNLRPSACIYPYRNANNFYEKMKSIRFADLAYYEPWYDFDPEIKLKVVAPGGNSSTVPTAGTPVGLVYEGNYSNNRSQLWNGKTWNFISSTFLWNVPYKTMTLGFEWSEIDDYGQSSEVTLGLSGTYGTGTSVGGTDQTPIKNTSNFSITPSIGYKYTKKAKDQIIGFTFIDMLECPPYTDNDAYVLGGGSAGFRWSSGN